MKTIINQRTDKQWDDFSATMFAEGALDGENATPTEQLEAWAYLIATGRAWQLQGFYGRNAQMLIDRGLIATTGYINWDMADAEMERASE